MKAKFLISSLLLGTVILALAKEDPVLMTINGKDIKLSEFEYLYQKNNQQQVEKETLDQYVDRFILYKQKVADAETEGIDTTEVFRHEFEGYQNDLAAPYMTEDTTYRWHYISEAYERCKTDIDIDHFMLPLGSNPQETQASINRMDSIRNVILAGESWEKLVDTFSSDASKTRNHGRYGFISACSFPYDFENMVYSTPVGEISKPFRTQYGIHMIRVNGKRPREDVKAQHILKLFPQNATPEQMNQCKAQIDSIYKLLVAGADFEEMAKAESQDPGSAKDGGNVGWFQRGRMVKPFEDVAYALPDGAISEPFETQYGYHIVKKLAHGVPPLADIRRSIDAAIQHDDRVRLIHEQRLNDLKAKYGYKVNPDLDDYLTKAINANDGFDSTFVNNSIKGSTMPMFTYAGNMTATLSELVPHLNMRAQIPDAKKGKSYVSVRLDLAAEKILSDYNARELLKNNAEYHNLLNEYRDGMLLFEISNRRVWKAASKDTVGLENHFAQNRAKYNWDEPHFKGIILSARNDSVLNLVKADLMKMPADSLTDLLHYKYGSDIRMERMVVKKGENNLADYLAFHEGDKPERKGYDAFMILEGGLISQPQDMNDVRGAVTSDYQDVLEQRWKEELQAKYPAKINKKVLKKLAKKVK